MTIEKCFLEMSPVLMARIRVTDVALADVTHNLLLPEPGPGPVSVSGSAGSAPAPGQLRL